MTSPRMWTPICAASLLATVLAAGTVGAQRLERQQEVRIPSLDLALKAGWQLLVHDGCRVAVPGSWHAEQNGGFISAPDGSNLSVRVLRITSWSAHKAQIRAAFGQVKVLHEDSDRRLWFEIGDAQRTQHYVDVPNGVTACAGLMEIRAATTPDAAGTAKMIADSLGSVP